MKKGLIIAGLLSSCTGSNRAVATPDSPPPLIVGGEFDDATSSNLGLLTRDTGINGVGATSVRIDLPLPELSGGGGDRFILGLECDTLQASICGGDDLRCYSCTAYGESSSGLPEDFIEYSEEVVKTSRCTALIATQDLYISGIVNDPRGYKYQIKTLLPPESTSGNMTSPGYGYKGIRVQDWNITVEYSVPEEEIMIPIGDHRALFTKELRAPKIKSQVRRLPETKSSRNRRTQAKAKADDDGSTITLMYYMTKRAMCQWTDQSYDTCVNNLAALVPMVAVCTAYGNKALKDSNIDYQYETVHIHVDEEFDEGTYTGTSARLSWITASETAATLRDQYGADLVVDVYYYFLTDFDMAGGRGHVPQLGQFPRGSRKNGFSSQYGIFLLMPYMIAHEVGHNMGLQHNREEEDGGSPDMSNYGYNDCNECFMTIMSYDTHCKSQGCPQGVTIIPYFSNVEVKYTDTGGSYAMGDAANDNSAFLEQSKLLVAINRFKFPQRLLESPYIDSHGIPGVDHLFFSVVAKESAEVNNIEFYIEGAMEVKLYTATGPFEGQEWNSAFWGDAHVIEDVTPMSDTNPLITPQFSVFENFPTLSLSKGSTTSFKIKHEKNFYMRYGYTLRAKGGVFFENDHLQVTIGSMAKDGIIWTHPASFYGAFRYTLELDKTPTPTSAPTISTPVPTMQNCEDTLYVLNGNWKNCKKLTKDKSEKQKETTCNRWDKYGRQVKNHCPTSCLFDCAERCADDPKYVVVREKGKKEVTYTCEEIPNKEVTCNTIVEKQLVGEYCRASCGMCH